MIPLAFTRVYSRFFRVTTNPVAKARPRVALRGGKAHAYTPTKSQEAEWRIRDAFTRTFPTHQPWDGPVALTVTAHLAMPTSTPKRARATATPLTRPDADNYLKTVLDALNRVAFTDDSRVITVTCSKVYTDMSPAWDIEVSLLKVLEPSQPAATPDIPAQEAYQANGRRARGRKAPQATTPS